MSSSNSTCQKMYRKLKENFRALRATLNPHLDVEALAADGVDVSFIDLLKEKRGDYFLPMSQTLLQSLDQRPPFNLSFSMEEPRWSYGDGVRLLYSLADQLLKHQEETRFRGIDATKWHHRGRTGSLESRLHEHGHGDISDPTRQHNWELAGLFDTEFLPHEMCISIHVVPNVCGPLRSEMMVILGLIGQRIKRRRFRDQDIYPLLMLSIIGREARIIQAHICPREQRLKVRYSQLFDFSHYTSTQRDLFIRWLMSDPIAETKPLADVEERPTTSADTIAPQLKASEATSSRPYDQELLGSAPRMSGAATVVVA